MAMTVESFQRFESQKLVGRSYPWLAPHQVQSRINTFRRTLSSPNDIFRGGADEVKQNISPYQDERKTMNVEENNFDNKEEKMLKEIEFVSNITDDDKLNSAKLQVPDEVDDTSRPSSKQNVPDDDLLENIDEIKQYLRKTSNAEDLDSPNLRLYDEDIVPSLPPPPRPTSTRHPLIDKLNRMSTFKDMLVFNAEAFIKDNVPRLPDGMFEHHSKEKEIKSENVVMTPSSAVGVDETDILLPTRRKVVGGIESDDMVAKFISFLGWVMFLLMRMISLSVFAVFYPEICGWICLSHYLLMLVCLFNETRFTVKWQRTSFYLILAYIFIFNLLEFKVKFKNVRWWYVGYFVLVMTQNVAMTIVWYNFTEFEYSWWLEFMFLIILQSGLMSLMCFVLYFFYLKPEDKVFFVNE